MANQKLKIYIVKKEDTVEKIALEQNVDARDIYRLNPLVKNQRLVPGAPLNLLVKENEERSEEKLVAVDSKIVNKKKCEDDTKAQTFVKLAYTIKEILFHECHTKKASSASKASLSKLYNEITLWHNSLLDDVRVQQLNNYLRQVFEPLFLLPNLFANKDQKAITRTENLIDEKRKQLSSLFIKFHNKDQILLTLEKIQELFQFYILKLLSYDFEDGEDIFSEINDDFMDLYKSLKN